MNKYNTFYNSGTGKYEIDVISSIPDNNGRITKGSRHIAYIAKQINKDLKEEQGARLEDVD